MKRSSFLRSLVAVPAALVAARVVGPELTTWIDTNKGRWTTPARELYQRQFMREPAIERELRYSAHKRLHEEWMDGAWQVSTFEEYKHQSVLQNRIRRRQLDQLADDLACKASS